MTGISDKHEVILINLFQKVLTKNYSSVLEKSRDKITYTKTCHTTGGFLFSPEKAVEEVSHVLKAAF